MDAAKKTTQQQFREGDPCPAGSGLKTRISYHLSQAIFALGKDDLKRVDLNLNKADEALDELVKERNEKRRANAKTSTVRQSESNR